MTSVPPTQPPAAPETDVRLTDDERHKGEVMGLAIGQPGAWFSAHAVERIVAERVRVVEGERDDIADRLSALLCDLTGGRMSKTGYSVSTMIQAVEAEFEKHATEDTAALVAEHQWNALQRAREADLATARAESAEAAHAAMVKVLGEYFDFDVDPWDDHDAACPAPEDVWRLHRDLRALLAGGAS